MQGDPSYQGADQVGITHTLFSLPKTLVAAYKTMAKYYVGDSIVFNRSWHRDVIFLILAAAVLTIAVLFIIRKKLYCLPGRFVAALVLAFFLVPGLNVIVLMVPDCSLFSLNSMQMAMLLPILFSFLEQADAGKWNAVKIPALLMSGILLMTWFASTEFSYTYSAQTFRQAEMVSERIVDRVETTEGYYNGIPVMIAGIVDEKLYLRDNAYADYTWGGVFLSPLSHGTLEASQECWRKYLLAYLGMSLNFTIPPEQREVILGSERFQEMDVWPGADSVSLIDNILVVKLNPDPPR